jgi:hypothetical protein
MYAHHQRLLDVLKSLDLTWPEQAKFAICFNNDVNVGLVGDVIKTATITIYQENGSVELGLDDLPVAHA